MVTSKQLCRADDLAFRSVQMYLSPRAADDIPFAHE